MTVDLICPRTIGLQPGHVILSTVRGPAGMGNSSGMTMMINGYGDDEYIVQIVTTRGGGQFRDSQ